jgi:V8-like Glu-specific endopeptidase
MKKITSLGLIVMSVLTTQDTFAAREPFGSEIFSSAVRTRVDYNTPQSDVIGGATATLVPRLGMNGFDVDYKSSKRLTRLPGDTLLIEPGSDPTLKAGRRSATGPSRPEPAPRMEPSVRSSIINDAYWGNFTSSRATIDQSRENLPYSAVGKLFFTSPTGKHQYCTAAVIKKGVIVTSPECLHSGTGGDTGWSSNLYFVPGYSSDGKQYSAPWGVFEAKYMMVHVSRFQNPNAATTNYNWGIVVMKTDSNGESVGSYTGKLAVGYNMTDSFVNYGTLTKLGYTPTLDGGREMQRVDMVATGLLNNPVKMIYGTDMVDGSLGAPLIANSGDAPKITPIPGLPTPKPLYSKTRNIVIGVHGYQYQTASGTFGFGGFVSPFQNVFKRVLEAVCADSPAHCK